MRRTTQIFKKSRNIVMKLRLSGATKLASAAFDLGVLSWIDVCLLVMLV